MLQSSRAPISDTKGQDPPVLQSTHAPILNTSTSGVSGNVPPPAPEQGENEVEKEEEESGWSVYWVLAGLAILVAICVVVARQRLGVEAGPSYSRLPVADMDEYDGDGSRSELLPRRSSGSPTVGEEVDEWDDIDVSDIEQHLPAATEPKLPARSCVVYLLIDSFIVLGIL